MILPNLPSLTNLFRLGSGKLAHFGYFCFTLILVRNYSSIWIPLQCSLVGVTDHQFSVAPNAWTTSVLSRSVICFPMALPINSSSAFARQMKNA